jgi:hypothetical protein
VRTGLAAIIIVFLLVRGSLTGAAPAALGMLAAVAGAAVLAPSLTRLALLGRADPTPLSTRIPWVVSAGVCGLASIGCLRIIAGH